MTMKIYLIVELKCWVHFLDQLVNYTRQYDYEIWLILQIADDNGTQVNDTHLSPHLIWIDGLWKLKWYWLLKMYLLVGIILFLKYIFLSTEIAIQSLKIYIHICILKIQISSLYKGIIFSWLALVWPSKIIYIILFLK